MSPANSSAIWLATPSGIRASSGGANRDDRIRPLPMRSSEDAARFEAGGEPLACPRNLQAVELPYPVLACCRIPRDQFEQLAALAHPRLHHLARPDPRAGARRPGGPLEGKLPRQDPARRACAAGCRPCRSDRVTSERYSSIGCDARASICASKVCGRYGLGNDALWQVRRIRGAAGARPNAVAAKPVNTTTTVATTPRVRCSATLGGAEINDDLEQSQRCDLQTSRQLRRT